VLIQHFVLPALHFKIYSLLACQVDPIRISSKESELYVIHEFFIIKIWFFYSDQIVKSHIFCKFLLHYTFYNSWYFHRDLSQQNLQSRKATLKKLYLETIHSFSFFYVKLKLWNPKDSKLQWSFYFINPFIITAVNINILLRSKC